jgi:hypothetical protein
MNAFEDEIRQALKAKFDGQGLIEAGNAKDIFGLIGGAFPISGSKIDWARVPDAVECVEEVVSDRPKRFVEFFAEICDLLQLKGPVFYVGDSATDFALAGSIEAMKSALSVLLEIPQLSPRTE